jgi:hypothetical protein
MQTVSLPAVLNGSEVTWTKRAVREDAPEPPDRRGHVVVAAPGSRSLILIGGRMNTTAASR